jgi:hypothetical protein
VLALKHILEENWYSQLLNSVKRLKVSWLFSQIYISMLLTHYINFNVLNKILYHKDDTGIDGTGFRKIKSRTRPILPLKNSFERNFLAFFKVYFSPPKQIDYTNYVITIPMQLTKSKYEIQKFQNDCQGFPFKKASLTVTFVKHESTQRLE